MSMRRIGDKEFTGWQAMTSLERNDNYWIYFSPDNTEAALVNTINNQIIFLMDRRKHAQFFYAMKGGPIKGRQVV